MKDSESAAKPAKPLGRRGYGSTPHLPGSRVGPGDWTIHEGQARILTSRPRKGDRIIVTEKLDGSCTVVARLGGDALAVTRAGYLASDSPYPQHHGFASWVAARRRSFARSLPEGVTVAGEWLLQAHGTRYRIEEEDALFVAFAAFDGKARMPHDDARTLFREAGLRAAAVVSDGPPMTQEEAMAAIGDRGFHGALDPVEGAVWTCERDGAFDFIAKHVVAGKVDGCYLPRVSGLDDVWNYDPAAITA